MKTLDLIKRTKFILIICFLLSNFLFSQTDYSENWEDFYSYNNVKDFVKVDTKIYALVDNAIFIYDVSTNEINKMSSVNGLSGEIATSIHYNVTFERLAIGYANGLLEIVDANGEIIIAPDISNFPLATEKSILNITEYNGVLYLSTSFAIVVYDIGNLVFGDTYFIGDQSTEVKVNETIIFNEIIYAATENGIYTADVNNPSLIDFNNWTKFDTRNFTSIVTFNNEIYVSFGPNFYRFSTTGSLQLVQTVPSTILRLKASNEFLSIAIKREAYIYDTGLNLVSNIISDDTSNFYFELNAVFTEGNTSYLCTKEFGILQTDLLATQPFVEIHPDGPTSNESFSISVLNDNLWVVYGGYKSSYNPLSRKFGFSHFNSMNWVNTSYNRGVEARDLVDITIDPNNEANAFISSYSDGIVVVEDDVIITIWDDTNSDIVKLVGWRELVSSTIFDNQGNLWGTNILLETKLVKRSEAGSWSSHDISTIMESPAALGLNEMDIDKTGSIWIGTRRNGVLVYNERGDRKRALTTEATKGSLPHLNVRTVAVDNSNRIWIGTQAGMVVYYNAAGLFDADIYDAEPVIILDDGIPKKLLGDQVINSISVDGADNKWFGTESGGALQASPNGRETLNIFNTSNSPLPSNTILKVKVDTSTGKVYFATDRGIVAFNNSIAAYGDTLDEVYAYPNPAKKQHDFITIDGRNGTHLPQGTNVKILDSAGYLVYETNVVEGQELKGGKVVWDKTNLAGRKVASGIYIVLLTTKDNEEVSSTKIAIIN